MATPPIPDPLDLLSGIMADTSVRATVLAAKPKVRSTSSSSRSSPPGSSAGGGAGTRQREQLPTVREEVDTKRPRVHLVPKAGVPQACKDAQPSSIPPASATPVTVYTEPGVCRFCGVGFGQPHMEAIYEGEGDDIYEYDCPGEPRWRPKL